MQNLSEQYANQKLCQLATFAWPCSVAYTITGGQNILPQDDIANQTSILLMCTETKGVGSERGGEGEEERETLISVFYILKYHIVERIWRVCHISSNRQSKLDHIRSLPA